MSAFLASGCATVSSHVSHDPHGVGPPAQLVTVPAMLGQAWMNCPCVVSNSKVVVPPPAVGSYARASAKAPALELISWLRTSRMRP